jgi:hypothetical protein
MSYNKSRRYLRPREPHFHMQAPLSWKFVKLLSRVAMSHPLNAGKTIILML